jgi:hypothetical protein
VNHTHDPKIDTRFIKQNFLYHPSPKITNEANGDPTYRPVYVTGNKYYRTVSKNQNRLVQRDYKRDPQKGKTVKEMRWNIVKARIGTFLQRTAPSKIIIS